MKIKKNDQVQVIAGKDRGKKGKVLQALPDKNKVVVEGVNMMAKNVRPKRSGEKGQVVRYNAPIDVSNVKKLEQAAVPKAADQKKTKKQTATKDTKSAKNVVKAKKKG